MCVNSSVCRGFFSSFCFSIFQTPIDSDGDGREEKNETLPKTCGFHAEGCARRAVSAASWRTLPCIIDAIDYENKLIFSGGGDDDDDDDDDRLYTHNARTHYVRTQKG